MAESYDRSTGFPIIPSNQCHTGLCLVDWGLIWGFILGRRKAGPVLKSGSSNYYARLVIPPALRPRAGGKTKLMRSLGTASHADALRKWGPVMDALEQELEALVSGLPLRERVEQFRDEGFDPLEATRLVLKDNPASNLSAPDPATRAVFQALSENKPLGLNWNEAVQLWKKEKSRVRTRPIADSSVEAVQRAVDSIARYGLPDHLTKQNVKNWLTEMELTYSEVTVAARFRYIGAVLQVLVETDHIETNVVRQITYKAVVKQDDSRRAFTDEELLLVKWKIPQLYYITLMGLRPGEALSRMSKDIDGDMLIVHNQPKLNWRPKTLSSYRRVPLVDGFKVDTSNRKVSSRTTSMSELLREYIDDPQVTPHSGRHTFYELSRRAGCDQSIIEKIAGHSSSEGSKSAKAYGGTPDDVLIRETQKIWDFVNNNITNENTTKTDTD